MFSRHIRYLLCVTAFVSLFFTCAELPTDPSLLSSNSSVSLFLKDGGNPVIEYGASREIGLEIRLTHLLDTIRIYSECVSIDTIFPVDSTRQIDTLWFNPRLV